MENTSFILNLFHKTIPSWPGRGVDFLRICIIYISILFIPIQLSATEINTDTLIGYASVNAEGITTTTGGLGGSTDTVKTLQELINYATARMKSNVASIPKTLVLKGKFESPDGTPVTVSFKRGANLTIIGLGKEATELKNVGLVFVEYKNLIIKNLYIHEVEYPEDALTIENCNHVWINRCELHSKRGTGITVDTYDGLLDIKKGSRYVTISWCYLYDHMKCSLIGHTDNVNQQAQDSLFLITYHHNRFSNTNGRNPSIRFGNIHIFNNLYENIDDYAITARDGAHAKVENNYFDNVLLPMTTDKFPIDGLPNGYICESSNFFTESCGANSISQTACNYWDSKRLPYIYKPDSAKQIKLLVTKYAGLGVNHILPIDSTVTPEPTDTTSVPVDTSTITPVDTIIIVSPNDTSIITEPIDTSIIVNPIDTIPSINPSDSTNNATPEDSTITENPVDSLLVNLILRIVKHDFQFDMYPNPATNKTTLSFVLAEKTEISISIHDLTGKQILKTGKQTFKLGYNNLNINTLQLKQGVYMVKLQSAKFVTAKYLIIK